VVSVEQPGISPPVTLAANVLHGDAVVTDLDRDTSWQVGALAVQAVGPNNGDRLLKFDNAEYASFPRIVTANFWSPNEKVDPRLVLFNVDFRLGQTTPPVTQCSLNYVNAEEDMFSRSFSFGCWTDKPLSAIAPGFLEDILGTANGFLWAACDAGTHGAIVTRITGDGGWVSEHADTMFQSVTTGTSAALELGDYVVDGGQHP
jgi:hypothetical protein